MKLKLSSTFMTLAILTFAVFSIASIDHIDKIFAKNQAAGDGSNGITGDKLSNAEKMKVVGGVLGMIFGGGGSESNTPNNILPGFASSWEICNWQIVLQEETIAAIVYKVKVQH